MAEASGEDRLTSAEEPLPTRAIYATYGVGLTANAVAMMLKVVIPLWAIQLHLSATQIGIAIGVSALLPFLLSIHGGVLMDRLGTRRVTMAYAVTTAALTPLYPALPFFAALVLLQLLTGLTANMGWVGAQTLICGFTRGKTTLLARFSVAGRIGTLGTPIAIGAMWDVFGAWGAFLFIGAAAWLVVLALWLVPAPDTPAPETAPSGSLGDRLASISIRWSDYAAAFSLVAIPVVAFVVVMSALRISSAAVQTSFYLVYLQEIGLTGTMIGVLVSISEGAGLFGALMAGWWERHIKPQWVFLMFASMSLFCVCITPALGGIVALLALATFGRGYAQGLSQPVMFGILARAVGPERQGISIGLRTTSNRAATVILPAVMGIVADAIGIENSFYVVGAFLLGCCAVVGLVLPRVPGFVR